MTQLPRETWGKLPGRSAGDTRCELYVAQCSSAHTKFCDGRGGGQPGSAIVCLDLLNAMAHMQAVLIDAC